MAPQVVGQLFGVYLPIFNFKPALILKQHQIFKIAISINFTNPLRETI